MGLFDRDVKSQLVAVLKNELGREVEINEIVQGNFSISNLGFEIRGFTAAINDGGIFFAQKNRLVIGITWSDVLICETAGWGNGANLVIFQEIDNKVVAMSQFPSCYWHKPTIQFATENDLSTFLNEFKKAKSRMGFTDKSLDLLAEVLKMEVLLPVSLIDYHKANSEWETEEVRVEAYAAWQMQLASQAFLTSMSRLACAGEVPGSLVATALSDFTKADEKLSEYTHRITRLNESVMKTLTEVTALPWNNDSASSNNSEDWVVAKVATSDDEWQPPERLGERSVAVQIRGRGNGHPSIKIWNDYHSGEGTIIFDPSDFMAKKYTYVDGLKVSFSDDAVARAMKVWS
jgi:hypothetical protein